MQNGFLPSAIHLLEFGLVKRILNIVSLLLNHACTGMISFLNHRTACMLIAISGQYDIYCPVGNFNALAHASIRLKAIESSAKICRS